MSGHRRRDIENWVQLQAQRAGQQVERALPVAIDGVAEQRAAEGGGVGADLVGSAGAGTEFEPGDAGLKHGVEAFQRHFRPGKVDGVIDRETVALLEALLRRYPATSSAADIVRP